MEVRLHGLNKSYGDHWAVQDLSLDVQDGEFLVLLGPSGCGKTTTLRMIAGLTSPDRGDVLFDDRRVNDVHPSKRDIAMVFQDYALYPHKSVYGNIAFNLRVRGLPRDTIRAKVEMVAASLHINHLLQRKPGDLSGGERQRVALGRAIVRDPKLFLMDEPLSNLDAQLRDQMRVELKALQRRLQVTTIYVTHDQADAMLLADRIAVMHDGVLQQVGIPKDIYLCPVNLFTATFIGTPRINLIEGDLELTESGVRFQSKSSLVKPDWYLPLPDSMAQLVSSGPRPVVLGFRAEVGRLVTDAEEDDVMELTVDFTEHLGSDTLLVTRVPDNARTATARRPVVIRTPGQQSYSPGDRALMHLTPQEIYVFDRESEQALFCRGRIMSRGVDSSSGDVGGAARRGERSAGQVESLET